MYEQAAFIYDQIAAFETPEPLLESIEHTLMGVGITPGAQLGDFGTGTGLMALMFAQKGWRVLGIDRSPAMLAEAQQKTRLLPADVQARLRWQQADLTQLDIPLGSLDAGICLCNTINHLPSLLEVSAFLEGVYRSLRSQGLFILDSDTLSTFERYFDHDEVVVWEDKDRLMTRECNFDQSSGRADHIGRIWQKNPKTLLSQEAMVLQYYPEKILLKAFNDSGFTALSAVPFNPFPITYPNDAAPKVLWVLQRP